VESKLDKPVFPVKTLEKALVAQLGKSQISAFPCGKRFLFGSGESGRLEAVVSVVGKGIRNPGWYAVSYSFRYFEKTGTHFKKVWSHETQTENNTAQKIREEIPSVVASALSTFTALFGEDTTSI